jgi:hypothetical protein
MCLTAIPILGRSREDDEQREAWSRDGDLYWPRARSSSTTDDISGRH